ncbi:MAG: hypothetical protein IKJ74_07730 [Clostridia bacterium]|nr:hypothetical protein [Clostridia bacterium]
MKRLLICLCAILLICTRFEIGYICRATTFSSYDLSNFGVSSLKATPVSSAPEIRRLALGSGLRALSSYAAYEAESYRFDEQEALVYQDLSISYSEDLFLVEASYSPAATGLFCSVLHPKYGSVYMITLEMSFVPGDRVCERMSSLTNTYFFSAADLSCVAVEGTRIRYGAEGGSLVSNFNPSVNQNAFVSPKGERWDSAAYSLNTSLRMDGEGELSQFAFSFCISIDDVLTTLSSEEADYVRRALSGGESFLCGGFDLRPVIGENYEFSDGVRDAICLSASLPCFASSPLSSCGEKWNQLIAAKESADPSLFTHVLAPLYLVGDVPDSPIAEKPEESPTSNGKADEYDEPFDSVSSQLQLIPPTDKAIVSVTTQSSFPSGEQVPPVSSQQFSFWDDLPDAESVPDETEQLFHGEEQEKTNLFSALSFLGVGILLFLTIVGAAILFRIDEKKGKKTKKT